MEDVIRYVRMQINTHEPNYVTMTRAQHNEVLERILKRLEKRLTKQKMEDDREWQRLREAGK